MTLYYSSINWPYEKALDTGPAQRCYSFSCFVGLASVVSWEYLLDDAVIAFFRQSGCGDNDSVRDSGSSGTFVASEHGIEKQIMSFMIMESGEYPIRGIVDACASTA